MSNQSRMSAHEYAEICRRHQVDLKQAALSRCWPDGQAPGPRMPRPA